MSFQSHKYSAMESHKEASWTRNRSFLAILNAWIYTNMARYMPSLVWLRAYSQEDLVADLLAGLTVGFFIVPQGLAYSLLAGVPPNYGLYTAVFAPLVYALFGSSKHLAFGPDAVTALILGSSVHEIVLRQTTGAESTLDAVPALPSPEVVMTYTTVVSFTVGLTLFLFGVFRLGFLDNVLSRSVVGGLIVAVATTIIVSQFSTLFGFPACVSKLCPETSLWKLVDWIHGVQEGRTHTPTLTIACVTIIGMHLLSMLKEKLKHRSGLRHLPVILIVISSSVFASWFLDLSSYGVKTLGRIAVGFVRPVLPPEPFVVFQVAVRPALAVAALIYIKSIVVAKEQAAHFQYSISPNQELRAMGLANMIASSLGAFTASGSLARTKVAVSAGARTPMTLIFASLLALVAVFVLMPLLRFLPSVTLASVIAHTVGGLIAPHASTLVGMWRVGAFADILLFGGMVVISFITDIETGLVFGFGACLLLLIRQTSQASAQLLGFIPPQPQEVEPSSPSVLHRDGASLHRISPWQEIAVDDVLGSPDSVLIPGVLIFKFFGALHFGNCEAIKNFVSRASDSALRIHSPQSLYGTSSLQKLQRAVLSSAASSQDSLDASPQSPDSPNELQGVEVEAVESAKPTALRAVILDLCQVPATDSSAIEMLHELVDRWEESDVHVMLVLHDISPPPASSGSNLPTFLSSPSAMSSTLVHLVNSISSKILGSQVEHQSRIARSNSENERNDSISSSNRSDASKEDGKQEGGVDVSALNQRWFGHSRNEQSEDESKASLPNGGNLDDLCNRIIASETGIPPLSNSRHLGGEDDSTDAENMDERAVSKEALLKTPTSGLSRSSSGTRRLQANECTSKDRESLEISDSKTRSQETNIRFRSRSVARDSVLSLAMAQQPSSLQRLTKILTRAAPFGTLHNLVFLSGLSDKLSRGHGALFLSVQAALTALHERGLLPSPQELLHPSSCSQESQLNKVVKLYDESPESISLSLNNSNTATGTSTSSTNSVSSMNFSVFASSTSPVVLNEGSTVSTSRSDKGMNPFNSHSTLSAAIKMRDSERMDLLDQLSERNYETGGQSPTTSDL